MLFIQIDYTLLKLSVCLLVLQLVTETISIEMSGGLGLPI
jgi:hypothetical protein